MVIDVRLEHEENAELPIVVTLGGMVMETRLSHPLNAQPPIEVTLGGMVIDVRLLQPPYLLLVDYQYYTL